MVGGSKEEAAIAVGQTDRVLTSSPVSKASRSFFLREQGRIDVTQARCPTIHLFHSNRAILHFELLRMNTHSMDIFVLQMLSVSGMYGHYVYSVPCVVFSTSFALHVICHVYLYRDLRADRRRDIRAYLF